MSVEIYGGTYISGEPTAEYTIQINGVGIELGKEDFKELCNKLGGTVSEDYLKMMEVKDKYKKVVEQARNFRTDIRLQFWEEDHGFFMRKSPKEIDTEALYDMLEKYNEFLGFE